ncbi:MAG: RdgB/HAM1 family non-canonical purine NTP pyrophosphatase [Pirellulales bacterium]|nr:RdgB/HAM1 family non-canonical purine NTP pyrophosphatase [Pirellulales bacterium]
MSSTLILGTRNPKKGEELAELIAPLGIDVLTLADISGAMEVVEDGTTFAANASKKACLQAIHLGQWVLAEDSGLCVDALNGQPGVYSARYAGEGATDASNNRRLLAELAGTPTARRTAHYHCHMVLSDPMGEIRAQSHGICRGRIRTEPAGTHGFGYDPLFEILEYHRTFGLLPPLVKRVISHRGRAMRAIVPQIVAAIG